MGGVCSSVRAADSAAPTPRNTVRNASVQESPRPVAQQPVKPTPAPAPPPPPPAPATPPKAPTPEPPPPPPQPAPVPEPTAPPPAPSPVPTAPSPVPASTAPSPSPRSLTPEPVATGPKRITLLHFNDVYNIEPGAREPIGGAARLARVVKSFAEKNPMVLFGGDAYNPSLMSTITLGKQMPPILNGIGVHVSVMGNHDFDFGTDNLIALNKECDFPWLMANVLCKDSDEPYANADATWEVLWDGVRVGVVGLVEGEWMETLGAVNMDDLRYQDFIEVGRKHAQELRENGCELVIALTHMREPNDRLLLASVPEFDILMGGHDHHYVVDFIQPHGNLMVKSGTEFRYVTKVEVEIPAGGGKPQLSWEMIEVTGAYPEDPEVQAVVEEYCALMGSKMGDEIAQTLTDLDGRFQTVRNAESNLGNFVTDVWRKASHADMVILNSGSLRSDQIHPAGMLTVKDFVNILPMIDNTVVLEATGEQVLEVLENGVSQWPKLEGRFPQVAGIKFAFDPSQPPGQRVVPGSVYVGEERKKNFAPLELAKKYRVATKEYLANGKDGFDVFLKCKVLVDSETGIVIPTCVRNHLTSLDVLSKWDPKLRVHSIARKWSQNLGSRKSLTSKSFQSLLDLAEAKDKGGDDDDKEVVDPKDHNPLAVRCPETRRYAIAPVTEGRIINISIQKWPMPNWPYIGDAPGEGEAVPRSQAGTPEPGAEPAAAAEAPAPAEEPASAPEEPAPAIEEPAPAAEGAEPAAEPAEAGGEARASEAGDPAESGSAPAASAAE